MAVSTWRHLCLTYDGLRDSYKLYTDGVKVETGSFAGNRPVEPIRPGGVLVLGKYGAGTEALKT
jgi:hypothetical protein